jgi:hypothetical protein
LEQGIFAYTLRAAILTLLFLLRHKMRGLPALARAALAALAGGMTLQAAMAAAVVAVAAAAVDSLRLSLLLIRAALTL